jgi:hypothetical protein
LSVKEKAPVCSGSGGKQSVDGEIAIDGAWRPAWSHADYKTCVVCGQQVRFRARGVDRPPWARVLPHRTDGTPCRWPTAAEAQAMKP